MALALGKRPSKAASGDVASEIARVEEELRRLEGEQADGQRELTEAEALRDEKHFANSVLRVDVGQELATLDRRLADLRKSASQKAEELPRAKRYLESLRRPLWETEHREKAAVLEAHLTQRSAMARRMVEAQIEAVEAAKAWADWAREGRRLAAATNAAGRRIGAAELNTPNEHVLSERWCAPVRVLTGKEHSQRTYDRVLAGLRTVLSGIEGGN